MVINPGPTGLNRLDLVSEDQYFEVLNSLPPGNEKLEDEDPKKFVAKIGGDAVKELLKKTDVEKLSKSLRDQLEEETSQQKKAESLKRLRVLESFKEEEGKVMNKPEWMVLRLYPGYSTGIKASCSS